MSETQIAVVSEAAFRLYAKDGRLAALAQRINQLLRKRVRCVDQVASCSANLALAEQHLALVDFHLTNLLAERLALLEAP